MPKKVARENQRQAVQTALAAQANYEQQVSTAQRAAEVLRQVRSTVVGAVWDSFHTFAAGETPEEAVELFAGRILHVHIKDGKKHGEDWQAFGHFLGVLEERLRATQEELVSLRRSYAHLLDRLYPSNEVYVVARAV